MLAGGQDRRAGDPDPAGMAASAPSPNRPHTKGEKYSVSFPGLRYISASFESVSRREPATNSSGLPRSIAGG